MSDDIFERITRALERLAPAPLPAPDLSKHEAFVWRTQPDRLDPLAHVSRIPLDLLLGSGRARNMLVAETTDFASGRPANNVVLCGARGM